MILNLKKRKLNGQKSVNTKRHFIYLSNDCIVAFNLNKEIQKTHKKKKKILNELKRPISCQSWVESLN